MHSFAGYSFKEGKLDEVKRQALDDKYNKYSYWKWPYVSNGPSEWKIDNRIYLHYNGENKFRMDGLAPGLWVFGIGDPLNATSDGIVWGAYLAHIFDVVSILDDTSKREWKNSYPFKIEKNKVYYIENGEFLKYLNIGDQVSTPKGNGKVISIDDLNEICIDLQEDKEVYYEFPINEIKRCEQ